MPVVLKLFVVRDPINYKIRSMDPLIVDLFHENYFHGKLNLTGTVGVQCEAHSTS